MGLKVDIQKKMAGFELDVKFEAIGKPLALLGASGSGKSMTLRCIAGLEKPDCGVIKNNGSVLFDSFENINMPVGKRKVGFIFQNYALFPHMTIYDNIVFGLGNKSKDEKASVVLRELEKVHLKGLEKRFPHQLSGGQQQRAAIARALALEPEILLLDEPFSALDDHTRGLVVREMGEMLSNYKGTAIFVTHNMDEAYRLCENIVIISKGREESAGNKESIFRNPPTIETARITGCKNIIKVSHTKKNRVFVEEWGTEFRVNEDKQGIKYIGIRANNVIISNKKEGENTISCTPEYISEGAFRITLFMKPVSAKNSETIIQCEVSKKVWSEVMNRDNIYNLYFNADDIFTMAI